MKIIGVVSALKSEASCLVEKQRFPLYQVVEIGERTSLCLSSIGSKAARGAALKLCEQDINALVSFGVAAAVNNELIPGDLVLPEAVMMNGEILPVDLEWRNRLAGIMTKHVTVTVAGGILASCEEPLTSSQEKLALGEATGACAADMETAAIAKVAADAGISFLAIRAIVDPVEFSPPEALMSAVYPDGSVDAMQLIKLVLNGSVSIKTLIHLALGMHVARSALIEVVQKTGLTFASDYMPSYRDLQENQSQSINNE
ncbi:MAG: phosphorylase [Gammaproteobacteria bacterium]|nr:MAG: phosphorylase [Gammaproteobacteria bacterium]